MAEPDVAQTDCQEIQLVSEDTPKDDEEDDRESTYTITLGEVAVRTLFTEFTSAAQRKIEQVMAEPLEQLLSKSLQRGEDPEFDQLLVSLNAVAEHCLPSLTKTLLEWYIRQNGMELDCSLDNLSPRVKNLFELNKINARDRIRDVLMERRDLAVDFLFCLVLIEIIKKLPDCPVPDHLLQLIEDLAFKHFKERKSYNSSESQHNGQLIADLYAEVLGVLSHGRAQGVRKRFLKELKGDQPYDVTVSVIMGMRFCSLKMFPVEELEASFHFMQDCAAFFNEARNRDVRHAMAAMMVELLVPVAGMAKREVNVPAMKNFVEMLYFNALDLAKKSRHVSVIFPLVTVLLCISQKSFFLSNWGAFLTMCLANLKHKVVTTQRIALESLYRSIWVYMIRINGEDNNNTNSRLRTIMEALFPRGSRNAVPRNMPLNIYVRIIQFIAQEKLDFAFKEIISDLLGVNKISKQFVINPERMTIGLRAFLVIADQLEQKDDPPPMPSTIGMLPSGNLLRTKKSYLNTTLTETGAKELGIGPYYYGIRKALDCILRALDAQIGRSMSMINGQLLHKEVDDLISEGKAKIELFRTCVAAIPRCLPEGMTKLELVNMLSTLSVHVDNELRSFAISSLQTLLLHFPDWTEIVFKGFVNFIAKEVPATNTEIVHNSLRLLYQLLTNWKSTVFSQDDHKYDKVKYLAEEHSKSAFEHVFHCIEGLALVMLCSLSSIVRKIAIVILKEIRSVIEIAGKHNILKISEQPVIQFIDNIGPSVFEKYVANIPGIDKENININALLLKFDLQWLSEKAVSLISNDPFQSEDQPFTKATQYPIKENEMLEAITNDQSIRRGAISTSPWISFLLGLFHQHNLPKHCCTASMYAWLILQTRTQCLSHLIDPSLKKPSVTAGLPTKNDFLLLQYYLMLSCACCTHSILNPNNQCLSDQVYGVSIELGEKSENLKSNDPIQAYLKTVLSLLRHDSEAVSDAAISALGHCNAATFKFLSSEISIMLKERVDKQKAESVRKRRKRDPIRIKFVKIFEIAAENSCFVPNNFTVDKNTGLNMIFVDYIETTRCHLDLESSNDAASAWDLRLHFCNFLRNLINNVPDNCRPNLLTHDMRRNLFLLCASCCEEFTHYLSEKFSDFRQCRNPPKDVMLSALEGMSAIACCGPVFDLKGIEENGYLYEWLDSIIECKSNRKIYGIGCRTVELLLAYNETCHYFLDWISNKCLTASPLASCGLFRAFLNIFSRRNYPLRLIRTLNVILFKAMDTDQESRGCAVRMLHVLDKRYLSIYRESTGLNVFSSSQFALITLKPEADLSATLAKLYPEFTIPMFSEMCVSLRKNVTEKRRLFINMLPWMQNIELIDNAASSHVTSNTEMICDVNLDEFLQARGRLQGEGWGSVTATEVVVCNLFHITCKYSDDYARELANLWCALCDAWNGNLRVIKNFFCILAGAGLSNSLLAQIKTVIMYIGERMPDRVIEELFQDLRLVENLAYSFDSSDSTGKQLAFLVKAKCLDPTVNTSNQNTTSDGADHTKKRKHSSVSDFVNVTNPSEDGFYRTIHRDGKYETEFSSDTSTVKEEFLTWAKSWSLSIRNGNGKPVPLPTPSDLLTHAPLYELFSADKSTIGHFRCYFSLMLISELLLNRVTFDSHIHMPLLLHVICLGMDHVHQVVHDHCKCLLIRLLILISYQDHLLDIDTFVGIHPFSTDVLDSPSEVIKRLRKGRKLTTGETLIADVDSLSTREFNKIEKLIELLLLSGHKPLWQCEEVTPRNMSIKSIDSLENFVKSIIDAASVLQSCKELKENWIQVALQWATSCSSRHYAGRSFQVLRLLCPPLNWPAFSDILSRLCDTATDLNEDVQGYVLEILLTLESAIDMRLSPLKKAIDEKLGRLKTDTNNFQKKRKNSTAEMYAGSQRSKIRQRNTSSISGNSIINVHTKSGSRSESILSITEELKIDEFCNDETFDVISGDVSRQVNYDDVAKGNSESKADHHGNNHTDDNLITEDELSLLLSEESRDLLARIFWSCVCLLESDYEHEFLVSLRIINKLFKSLRFCKVQFYANLEIILNQMEWTNYPGLHALLLKGLTIPSTVTSTLQLLCWLIPDNDYRIIDPSQRIALPLSMIAVLPYLIQNFDSPDDFCVSCAQSFGSTCEKSRNLNNVATLLKMYIDKKYPQPCQVWLSAVCKYINDAYPDLLTTILTFLLEVLEFCPDNVRREHLLVLQSYVKHIDILSSDVQQWGGELIRTICRSLTGSHWSEALDIIRLVVAKSSVNSPQDSNEPRALWRLDTFGGMVKRELPGPTLSFNYDLSSTKIIGFSNTSYPVNLIHSPISSENDEDDELEIEKMCAAQNRTRNCLRLLTSTCGNKSALIKNSYQSIVFSSTSSMQAFDRRQTIEKSSSDEGLIMDEVTHKNSDFRRRSLIGVVTDFDFLDDEYKVNEQANSPLFNWASVSVLHSPSAESIISTTQEEINLRKDLSELASICKEMYESSDEESQSTIDDEESVKSIDINFKGESEELSVLPGPHTGDIPELVVDQKCDVEVAISDNRMEKLSESGTEISQDSCKLVTHKAGSHISMSSLESSIGIASEETYKRGSSASDGGMKELSEMWQIHASAVLSKRINSKLSCTHEIFIKTFNSIISTYQRLTDKSREITQLDEFQGIVVKLSHVSQLLYQVEIPFVYTDWESLTETGLMQEHAFHIIELHNYCKNICNLTDKLWEELYDITATEDICETVILKRVQESRIQLYGDLYQAAFTIILLLENYNKNIRELSMAISKSSKIVNITEDIEKCRTSLIDVKNKPSDRTSSPSSFWSETSNVKQKAISNIQECLVEESFQEALRLLHNSRRKWSGDVFGKDDKEDINILLTIYFKSITKTKHGVIAIQDYAEEVLRTCYTPIKGLLLEILPQLNDLKHEILCNYSNTSEVFHESKVFN